MKKFSYMLVFILICGTMFASQRKVLVEVFTNSHCPLCPPAHAAIESFMQNDSNGGNVTYIFYHMVFPYPDDPLNQANPNDPADRNNFYGPFFSTPHGIFDGQVQSNSYSSWAHDIDGMVTLDSPFELTIKAQGQPQGGILTITASVKQTVAISASDLKIYFVAVENTNYTGRNGVKNNINVMRKMFPGSSGKSLSISLNQALDINQDVTIDSNWNTSNLGFVVFIQDNKNKMVYQSAYMSYNSLVTDVEETGNTIPLSFTLNQNYPNPFNPTTTISFTIPNVETGYASSLQHVVLTVYDILGNEVATLANEYKPAGNYSVKFNANGLSSGLYFYKLTAGNFVEAKKMLLLK